MPDATTTDATTTQGADVAQAQGADQSPVQGTTGTAQGATGSTGEGTADVQALTEKIAALEKDNRTYRQREAQREREQRERAQAEMSETERLLVQNQELERRLAESDARAKEQSLRLTAVGIAQRLGFRNVERAMDHLMARRSSIEYDDDGTPKNVEKLLTELAKSDPTLVTGTPDFGGGVRQPVPQGQDMNALIRNAAARR